MSSLGGGEHTGGAKRAPWALAMSVAVIGMSATLVLGTRASAAPQALAVSSTCPTEAYTGATIASCGSTTTTSRSGGHPHVSSAAYSNGRLRVVISGYTQSSTGNTIRLYVGGNTQAGWSAGVGSDQSAKFSVGVCLDRGSHTIAGVDQTDPSVPEATGSVSVSSAGPSCGSAGAGGGRLAFTGANVFKMLIAAFMAIVVGYVLVRFNRQRRRAS